MLSDDVSLNGVITSESPDIVVYSIYTIAENFHWTAQLPTTIAL